MRTTSDGVPLSDIYTRKVDEFLLQTPYHLLNNIQILRPVHKAGNKVESVQRNSKNPPATYQEFVLPDGVTADLDEARATMQRRSPEVVAQPYTASHGIEGHIYRFYYRLDFDLEMPSKNLCLPAGTEISLYNVIKYDMNSLVGAIRKRRFEVEYDPEYHLAIETDGVVREYAVFLAHLDSINYS
jgi:hypothetical protein